MRWLVHLIFIVLYLLVTFFGLGPVLLADGVLKERIITAIIVIAIYSVLTFFYRKFIKIKK
ncbi:MAG: hypothetical protein K0S25_786 [Bacillus sp. (in: firmicutes)]|jgi:hypothetical protein|nr:hypothetical protein [Bacillus sp. (in: firmicutes)]